MKRKAEGPPVPVEAEEVELKVLLMDGSSMKTKVSASMPGRDFLYLVRGQLPEKRRAVLSLCFEQKEVAMTKTLAEQGVHPSATLSCVYKTVNAWPGLWPRPVLSLTIWVCLVGMQQFEAWQALRGTASNGGATLHAITEIQYSGLEPRTLPFLALPSLRSLSLGYAFPGESRTFGLWCTLQSELEECEASKWAQNIDLWITVQSIYGSREASGWSSSLVFRRVV